LWLIILNNTLATRASLNTIKEMDMGITSGCIDFHQGRNGFPAGNNFSHSSNTSYNDYFTYSLTDDKAWIGYWYDSPMVRTPIQYSPSPGISIASTVVVDPLNFCKSSFDAGHIAPPIDELKTRISEDQTKIIALQTALQEGQNPNLITAIISNMDLGNLKNLLMENSPYLTDDILIQYLRRNDVPFGHLKEVIVANSPVSEAVIYELSNLNLPSGIRNEISSVQTGFQTGLENSYDLIKYYQFEISILKSDIVRSYVNDPTIDLKVDTLIIRIKEYEAIDIGGNVKEREILADLYTEKQDFVNAEEMITTIEADPSKQNLAKIKRVQKDLKQNNQTLSDLSSNPTEKQKVETVASDDASQGYEPATNILQQVFSLVYEEPIEQITVSTQHRYTPFEANAKVNVIAEEPSIVSYPNPANESISFSYTLVGDASMGTINVYNALGQMVKFIDIDGIKRTSTISISELPSGLYFYTLVVNNTTIAQEKFAISK
jgi:hypothetical protein